MRIGLSLKPGQGGTKRLLAKYGERLVCVRYRYDEKRGKRFKTVELIIEESAWTRKYQADEIIGVQLDMREDALRIRICKAGGKWNHKSKLWEMRYDRAVELGLKGRIIRLESI
jgi:hypothetical protein